MKKYMLSRDQKIMSGVLGGLGEYLHIDANIVRIIFVLLLLITGIFPFIILYILAAFFVPKAPHIIHSAPIMDDDQAI